MLYIEEAVFRLENINPEPKLVRSQPVRNKFISLKCPRARPDVSCPTYRSREIALSNLTLSLPFIYLGTTPKLSVP